MNDLIKRNGGWLGWINTVLLGVVGALLTYFVYENSIRIRALEVEAHRISGLAAERGKTIPALEERIRRVEEEGWRVALEQATRTSRLLHLEREVGRIDRLEERIRELGRK